jgi:hypothetical protein
MHFIRYFPFVGRLFIGAAEVPPAWAQSTLAVRTDYSPKKGWGEPQ